MDNVEGDAIDRLARVAADNTAATRETLARLSVLSGMTAEDLGAFLDAAPRMD